MLVRFVKQYRGFAPGIEVRFAHAGRADLLIRGGYAERVADAAPPELPAPLAHLPVPVVAVAESKKPKVRSK